MSVPPKESFKEVRDWEIIELTVNAGLAYRVLSHRFANHPNLRLQADEKSNSILVRAEPELMKEITELLEMLDGQKSTTDGTVIEVIDLSIDPQLAVLTIEKFFDLKKGQSDTKQTLTVDAIMADRKLIVRGSPEQIKKIKELLAKLGSSRQ